MNAGSLDPIVLQRLLSRPLPGTVDHLFLAIAEAAIWLLIDEVNPKIKTRTPPTEFHGQDDRAKEGPQHG